MSRPYPVLPPSRQQKPICVIPIPNSSKQAKQKRFNAREYWSWGANLIDRNCVPFDTEHDPYLYLFTWCGTGDAGRDDGPANLATFAFPCGLTVDSNGYFYVADTGNNLIRKISPTGVVTTVAGTGVSGLVNGSVSNAHFYNPTGVAIDGNGILYVADMGNNVIRKIENGIVSTLAGSGSAGSNDGTGVAASFDMPFDLALDPQSNVYITDISNNKIRVCTSGGIVSTFAGTGVYSSTDGYRTSATFAYPVSITFNERTSAFFITDIGTSTIRTISNNVVSTVIGNLNEPAGITTDILGNIFVASQGDFTVKKIVNQTAPIIAGSSEGFTDGLATSSKFGFPFKIVYSSNDIYVVDNLNNSIRRISEKEPSIDITLPYGTPPIYNIPTFPQYIYDLDYSIIGGGGGGGIGNINGGGGGGGGAGFTSGTFQNVRGTDILTLRIGQGGSGAYFNSSGTMILGSNGGDTVLSYGLNPAILSRGAVAGISGTINGGNGGSGSFGGGGGWGLVLNGVGGSGTNVSGYSGTAGPGGIAGYGGGVGAGFGGPSNKNRGGGGGGYGGGHGFSNACNATFYGAGGGGIYNLSSAGDGANGIISIRLTRTL
jgi:sugar lactone lactonase YvrE